jgi:hypothetical protein
MDTPLTWHIDRDKLFELIANGLSDKKAAEVLGVKELDFRLILINQPDVAELVDQAIKARADHWVGKVMETATYEYSKDEVPSAKLQFEKFKYLAAIDNPDKYSERKAAQDINLNVFDIKTITDAKALEAIKKDPFANAEVVDFVEIPKESKEEDLL